MCYVCIRLLIFPCLLLKLCVYVNKTQTMFTRFKSYAGSSVLSNGTNKQKYSPEKCRICLDDGEIPIFGANDISEEVSEFGEIHIGKDDYLPQYLCEACYTLLEAAILFRKTAKQSEEILRRTAKTESESEESDSKQEDETYIKKEYLEFNLSSSSESEFKDEFDWLNLKNECRYEDNTTNDNPIKSEANTHDSNDYQTDLLHVKREEDGSINEVDSETIMIIVSDKDKLQGKPNEDENSQIDDKETTKPNEPSLRKILPHQKECDVCHRVVLESAYNAHLKGHREKYKENYAKKNSKIECEVCGKHVGKCYIKTHMKMHGTAEEQAERLIECPTCNKMFSVRYYSHHVRRVHEKGSKIRSATQNVKTKELPPSTSNCNKCPVCDKLIEESDFKLHLEKHNGPMKIYMCDQCGREFKHQSAFKTHSLLHGSELKHKCQFCPYKGLHQGLLKIHVRTHTGDYNYKCTECPARFITKSNLSKHLMRHKGLCSFKCEECGKGFYSKRDLERHKRNLHMTAKNQVCEVCGKAFGHRDNMLCHQLKVHKREKLISRGRIPSYLKQKQQLE